MIPEEIREYNGTAKWQLGQRIQEKRLEKKLTAADVAAYLNVQANQISRIENGKANCTISQMYILAQLLDCSVDYLMFGKRPESGLSEEQQAAINHMMMAFGKSTGNTKCR